MHQKIAIEDDGKSFFKLIVKTKDQIVADGLNMSMTFQTWALIWMPRLEWGHGRRRHCMDLRNHYNEMGHFEGAICPTSETFRELPEVLDELKGKEDEKICFTAQVESDAKSFGLPQAPWIQ